MPRSLAVLTLLAGCVSPQYELYIQQHADGDGSSTAASGGPTGEADETTKGDAEPASTGSIGDASGDTSIDGSSDTTDSAGADETTDAADDPPVVNPEKPTIVSVELPAQVHAAGPVQLNVQTEHAAAVHMRLDGADAGSLIAAGDGLYTGELAVHGEIDNGAHEVEVVATQGNYEDTALAYYEVKTPKPGTEAWSQAGPKGSRTNRVAVTPEGDLIEVGQTETAGVARPTIRKRSGTTGAELWPEGTITLDTGEGAVVDVAVLPDGRMWVAMNVREPMTDPQPRIALLDADGHATEVDILGTSGRVVRGIAADADGGCFAVGLAGVLGDWDFAYWRIDAAGVQTLGDVYDYQGDVQAHAFRDLASDVLIDGDVAWMIGMSHGKHSGDFDLPRTRGVIVPMDLHTGELLAPATVAPKDGDWNQSAFFSGALHPDGVLVTGYGCDDACDLYRIETSLYSPSGERLQHMADTPNDGLAYGSDVVFDSQGRVLIAGAVMQGGKLRGYVFGRPLGQGGLPVLEHWYPGVGPSEALGLARDGFDRIYPAGYITANGETQARITRIHG